MTTTLSMKQNNCMLSKMLSPKILLKNQLIFIDLAMKIWSLNGRRLLITTAITSLIKRFRYPKTLILAKIHTLNAYRSFSFPTFSFTLAVWWTRAYFQNTNLPSKTLITLSRYTANCPFPCKCSATVHSWKITIDCNVRWQMWLNSTATHYQIGLLYVCACGPMWG